MKPRFLVLALMAGFLFSFSSLPAKAADGSANDLCATFDDLQAAAQSAADGETIFLSGTIEVPAALEIDRPLLFTGGALLRAEGYDGHLLVVQPEGEVTLRDVILAGGMSMGRAGGSAGSLVFVDSGGALVLETGAVVCDNTASTGGGIASAGTVVVNGGSVSGNRALHEGGGIFLDGGTLTLQSGVISGNSAVSGGGICASNGATLALSGGVISENSASTSGGVWAGANCRISVKDGTSITGNTAASQSSNLYFADRSATLTVDGPVWGSIGWSSKTERDLPYEIGSETAPYIFYRDTFGDSDGYAAGNPSEDLQVFRYQGDGYSHIIYIVPYSTYVDGTPYLAGEMVDTDCQFICITGGGGRPTLTRSSSYLNGPILDVPANKTVILSSLCIDGGEGLSASAADVHVDGTFLLSGGSKLTRNGARSSTPMVQVSFGGSLALAGGSVADYAPAVAETPAVENHGVLTLQSGEISGGGRAIVNRAVLSLTGGRLSAQDFAVVNEAEGTCSVGGTPSVGADKAAFSTGHPIVDAGYVGDPLTISWQESSDNPLLSGSPVVLGTDNAQNWRLLSDQFTLFPARSDGSLCLIATAVGRITLMIQNGPTPFSGPAALWQNGTLFASLERQGDVYRLSNVPAGTYDLFLNGADSAYDLTVTGGLQNAVLRMVSIGGDIRLLDIPGTSENATGTLLFASYDASGRMSDLQSADFDDQSVLSFSAPPADAARCMLILLRTGTLAPMIPAASWTP